MELVTTGSAIPSVPETRTGSEEKERIAKLKAYWEKVSKRAVPDWDFTRYAPERTLLLFREELQRLQPFVEYWYRERGEEVPDWPKIYFAPFEAWFGYFDAHPEAKARPEGAERDDWIAYQMTLLSALCPWRYTQGVYRFAPSFAKAICASSLKGAIPCEVLLRLPQWSIYVEIPPMRYLGGIAVGFWAHLQNADRSMETAELALLINTIDDNKTQNLIPFRFRLESETLEEMMRRRFETWLTEPLSERDAKMMGMKANDIIDFYSTEELRKAYYRYNAEQLEPLLAMLLYLCTTEPDIESARKPGLKPENNAGRFVKHGFRMFPADGPHIWQVGGSMENDLADHYRAAASEVETGRSGKRREVRSHVRSAHWHGYWKGRRPKENEKDMREFIFHWIPPLLVRGSRGLKEEDRKDGEKKTVVA